MSETMSDPSADLQIIGAVYGLGKVTSKVISLVDRSTTPQSLSVKASNDVFGDTWPQNKKTLTVAYRYGDAGAVCVKVVREGETLTIGQAEYHEARAAAASPSRSPQLSVLAATYGPSDVTDRLRAKIDPASQTLDVIANNAAFGPDPWPNVIKTLVVVANYTDQVPFIDIVQEGGNYTLKYRPPLQIISAYWGLKDVTERARSEIKRRALTVQASNSVFGDGWPGVMKTLDIVYQYGHEQEQLGLATENSTLEIDYQPGPPVQPSPDPRSLNVVRAAYGRSDVTDKVKSLIAATTQSLDFIANNTTFGDSFPNVRKSFALTYSWGPAEYQSMVAEEGATLSVHQPPTPYVQDIVSLAGLIADGDLIALQAGNGNYLAPDPATGQLLANMATRVPETAFTARPDQTQHSQLTLTDSHNRPVVVDQSTGTLKVAQGTNNIQPAKLVLSMDRSGSVMIGVLGSSRNFSTVQADGSILAGGTNDTTFNASFTLELNPSPEGLENHLRMYGVADVELPSPELLKVVWDLTGGCFLAIGLGPLLAGSNVPASGIYRLITSNARAAAALNGVIASVRANPEATLSIATIFSFIGVLWDTGLMWAIFRMALRASAWWLGAFAAAKLLEWSVLPEAAAAELTVSFAVWAYTTTTDVLSYVNSSNGSSELEGAEANVPALVAG